MVLRPVCLVATVGAVCLVWTGHPAAQMAHRLKGTVRTEQGAGVAGARVRADAIAGFRGGQFVGQKDFTVTANDKGEWSILGLTAGVWMFQASSSGMLPHAIVLTIDLVTRRPLSATGGLLRWELPLMLRSADGRPALAAAADAALQGNANAAAQQIGVLSASDDVEQSIAAGELALIVRQSGLADALFARAIGKEPKHPRALIGSGSAALMQSDWDRASKQYWQAREVAPANLRQALAATLADLQQVSAPGPLLRDRR